MKEVLILSRKFLLKLAMILTLFLVTISFAGLGVTAAAQAYQDVKIPNLKGTTKSFLMSSDSSAVVKDPNYISITAEQTDKHISVIFNNIDEYKLPDLGTGYSKYFVVLINKASGKPIDKKFLTKNADNEYVCEFDVPYYTDYAEFKVYKQKETDPDFKIDEANFIGKNKCLMAYHNIFTQLPNFITVVAPYSEKRYNEVVRIVLPDNQKHLKIAL